MRIFEITRIRLTAWYVFIIMAISTMFSFVIYQGITHNIEASFMNAETRMERGPGQISLQMLAESRGMSTEEAKAMLHDLLVEELENSKKNVFILLLVTNGVIFSLSSIVSYYLAGRTLMPIQEMIDEQKRFIADASHELKTPLTSLKTSIEVSIQSGKLPKDIEKLFQYNLEDVNALSNLIDRLLGLASLETKKVVFSNLDLKEVIKTAVKRVRYLSKEKAIKFKISTKNYQLVGDEASLTELFVILFDNAIKYSSKGGKIDVTVKCTRTSVIIKVADNGIGISEEHLPNIFDRFYRIDSSRTLTNLHGYGLGLSLAKKIVENHRGSIKVSSELSKGTTFIIKLPLKA